MGAAQAWLTLVELEGLEHWFRHLVVEALAAKEVPVGPHAEEAQGPVCEKPVAAAAAVGVAVVVAAVVGEGPGYAERVEPAESVEQAELAEHVVPAKGVEPVGEWHAVVERAAGAGEFGEFEGDLVVADAAVSHAGPAEPVAGPVAAAGAELAEPGADVEQLPVVEAGVEPVAVSGGEVEQQFEGKTEHSAEGTNAAAVAVAGVVRAAVVDAAVVAAAPLEEPSVLVQEADIVVVESNELLEEADMASPT